MKRTILFTHHLLYELFQLRNSNSKLVDRVITRFAMSARATTVDVRELILKSENLPQNVIEHYSKDSRPSVQIKVAEYPHCPEPIIRFLYEKGNVFVIQALVRHQKQIPLDILQDIAKNSEEDLVLQSLIERPGVSIKLLETIITQNPFFEKHDDLYPSIIRRFDLPEVLLFLIMNTVSTKKIRFLLTFLLRFKKEPPSLQNILDIEDLVKDYNIIEIFEFIASQCPLQKDVVSHLLNEKISIGTLVSCFLSNPFLSKDVLVTLLEQRKGLSNLIDSIELYTPTKWPVKTIQLLLDIVRERKLVQPSITTLYVPLFYNSFLCYYNSRIPISSLSKHISLSFIEKVLSEEKDEDIAKIILSMSNEDRKLERDIVLFLVQKTSSNSRLLLQLLQSPLSIYIKDSELQALSLHSSIIAKEVRYIMEIREEVRRYISCEK